MSGATRAGGSPRAFSIVGALHALSVLALCGAAATLAATLLAGGLWPLCLATPFLPQCCMAALCGSAGLLLTARPRRGWPFRALLTLGATASLYGLLVELAGCGRRVPTLPSAEAPASGTLSVLVCNVYSGNRDYAAVERLIAASNADVVLLLEVTSSWLAALAHAETGYAYRHKLPDDLGNFGIAVWSRHEIVRGGIVVPPDCPDSDWSHVPQVDVELALPEGAGKRRVRFLGLHPLPPVTPGTTAQRDHLLAWVAEQCARTSDLPTVVAGDFNASRYCAVALRLAAQTGLADATARLRRSWPTSKARLPMATRIDHIWASPGCAVVAAERGPGIGSDHFPVWARLALPPLAR